MTIVTNFFQRTSSAASPLKWGVSLIPLVRDVAAVRPVFLSFSSRKTLVQLVILARRLH